ncbi:hypothetical protein [Amycolatopsis saalfeldensis]|uniref:Uncharacterized protein n=1 Tax=Amycolatopsis saalfeldensis TaxID=394193 RepID=A0A1H8UFA5_9PSEU|nr:hypothetical protein [Amycolatopsis saalfeldensis]SEP01885.1 hypothetical protein SAMN04489732_103244 [Amycolatopsis saalfeldensis]
MFTELITGAALLGSTLLSPTAAPTSVGWSLWPAEVAPGGEMHVETYAAQGGGCSPAGPVTSPGFAAPIIWTDGGNFGYAGGKGKAGTRPGHYTATFTCTDGRVATGTFTITGTPPTSSPTPPPSSRPSRPSAPPAKHHQVAVRPAGAPQTGGGAPATSFTP